ncbi:hypothetical protein lerEdw1_009549 [Lerista edwardsae]|nr:hypothetical protein lerEdw1_009549 [Lerista edwardsae]
MAVREEQECDSPAVLFSPGVSHLRSDYSSLYLTMEIAKLCGLLFGFAGLLLLIVAVFSNQWVTTEHYNFGLWTVCWNMTCHYHGVKTAAAYINATRFFASTAIALSFIAFIGYFISFYSPHIGSVSVLKMSSIPSLLGGFSTMIAMTIFVTCVQKKLKDEKFYFSFGTDLAWPCSCFLVISGILANRTEPPSPKK